MNIAKFKAALKVGQRVRCFRTHDKSVALIGTVKRIHPGADDCVDVELEKDGKLVEVSGRVETVHAHDCKVLEDQPAKKSNGEAKPPKGETKPPKGETKPPKGETKPPKGETSDTQE